MKPSRVTIIMTNSLFNSDNKKNLRRDQIDISLTKQGAIGMGLETFELPQYLHGYCFRFMIHL